METSITILVPLTKAKIGSKIRELSYLVPPDDTPEVNDVVVITFETATELGQLSNDLHFGLITSVDDPAHPRATKMYLALIKQRVIELRQTTNNARDALYRASHGEKK
jgi:hypothetical protein